MKEGQAVIIGPNGYVSLSAPLLNANRQCNTLRYVHGEQRKKNKHSNLNNNDVLPIKNGVDEVLI